MAELIEEVDGSSGISRTEHVLRSVLNGDSESVRQKFIHALGKLGYKVISEDPLYVRRSAQGWATYHCSADILEYPIKLTIGLKHISPNATLATFDYAVEHSGSISYKGDQQTLKREAETIIALATSNAISVCTACGTKQISEARFCRICGAPNEGGDPAEIEVLRLTAGARAGHHLITTGAIWTAVSLLIALSVIFLGGRTGGLAVLILLSQVVFGLLILFWGALSLHRTLNPDLSKTSIIPINLPKEISTQEATAFPISPSQTFITEGTTKSLAEKLKVVEEKEFVYAKKRDTSPMD
jgi:hypothetical protein